MVVPMRSNKYTFIIFLWLWIPATMDSKGRFLGASVSVAHCLCQDSLREGGGKAAFLHR